MNSRDITGDWLDDMMGRVLSKQMEFVVMAEELYQEGLDLWLLHNNDDAAVADQLYPNEDPAEALAKAQEAKAALLAAHGTHQTYDWPAMRRVANFTRSRMG